MSPDRALAWIDRMVWILIYLGLFALVLGIATLGRSTVAAWVLIAMGGVSTVAGIVLIWVRSRQQQGS
jgi:hypothetical protein